MIALRQKSCRRLLLACAAIALVTLAGCDDGPHAPSESNTYKVHLYYGKGMAGHKYLGQMRGISQCKTAIHTQAAQMKLKPHSYTYDCCWVNAGKACFEKHK